VNPLTVVHTDGTIFTLDGDMVVGIDPTTGSPKFSIKMEDNVSDLLPFCEFQVDNRFISPPTVHQMMIAGDGYAYVAYSYRNSLSDAQVLGNCNTSFSHDDVHLRVLRIGSDGSNVDSPIGDWTRDRSSSNPGGSAQHGNVPSISIITNADQGFCFPGARHSRRTVLQDLPAASLPRPSTS
jgi:hypothetical protein